MLIIHVEMKLYRAEGRVLVFQYQKGPFSPDDERQLQDGVKAIATENTVSIHKLTRSTTSFNRINKALQVLLICLQVSPIEG